MIMFSANNPKVFPASGPSLSNRPSCTTPAASDANTSGMITKNNSLKNTCPAGSKISRATHCAPSRKPGYTRPIASEITPATNPTTSPNKMRFASFADAAAMP